MATGVQENLLDERVPEHRDASSSSQELPSEPRAKVVLGKHSIFSHFPKDRNCDICSRPKIARASCRRRTWYSRAQSGNILMSEAVADHKLLSVIRNNQYADLADHKVLIEGCESRNNHRYAAVEQELRYNTVDIIIHSRSLVWWEDMLRKAVRSTI